MAANRGGLVSVIIPCYLLDEELLDLTKDCVDSIRLYSPNAEFVIIDNGSLVGIDYLWSVADSYIRNHQNLGFAPAVNQGFEYAGGDWLVICNNDVRLLNDWITEAQAAWDNETGVIAAHRKEGRKLRRGTPWHVMWGALWMTRRDVVDRIGYLDERFKLGMREDRDYWLRMLQAGLDLVSVGHAWHKGNATWRRLPRQERREAYRRNKAYFEEKWKDRLTSSS